MDEEKFHFRHSMLYQFQLGYNANEAHKNLCFVCEPCKVKVYTICRWFEKFRSNDKIKMNLTLEDQRRSTMTFHY